MPDFKPMLGIGFEERALRFPYYASPKIDGMRCVVIEGHAHTRSMKLIPNRYVRQWFEQRARLLDGLDGELVAADPTAEDCYNRTESALMAQHGKPAFSFFVFDIADRTGKRPFADRWQEVNERVAAWPTNIGPIAQELVQDQAELASFEEATLRIGYEGVMLRRPASRYKQGRATLVENSLLKVKRFRDGEAIILGVEELMHNKNAASRNELGRTKRSTARAGLVGGDTLGALVVYGAPGEPFAGVQFSIGTGFDERTRKQLWEVRNALPKQRIRYRFFHVGTKDAPRHPVFAGFRQEGT